MRVWIPSLLEPMSELLGPIPDGVAITYWDIDGELPTDRDDVEYVMAGWGALGTPVSHLPTLPNLKTVQVLSAGVDWIEKHVPAHVTLCNGGESNAAAVADWCMAAILSEVRRFPALDEQQPRHEWKVHFGPAMSTVRIGIVGYGAIGKALHRRLEPFGCTVVPVASRARDGVHAVSELPELLPTFDFTVILAPLTDATRHLFDATMLARLQDGSTLINAGRGPIVHTDALMAELRAQRIRSRGPEALPCYPLQ